jgi:hypothetical protein
MKRRGEMRLIRSAIKQGWDVPEVERDKAMKLVSDILDDPKATAREILGACQTAIAADEDNLRIERQSNYLNL